MSSVNGNQSGLEALISLQTLQAIINLLVHLRLITIYDCKVDLKWQGKALDGTDVKGKLKIPEVSHEITLDGLSDYVVRTL